MARLAGGGFGLASELGRLNVAIGIVKPFGSVTFSCWVTSTSTLRSLHLEPNHEAISQPTPSKNFLIA